MQLIRFRLNYQKINHVFITHMHGDHYFGLLGLLSSMHLLGRTREINIYGPPDLEKVFKAQNQYAAEAYNYKIVFHALGFGGNEQIYEDKAITITTIKLKHRVPCNGFLIREKKRPRKIIPEAIEKYDIPIFERNNIKLGKDLTLKSGKVINNNLMTVPAERPRSYAYCSDTLYNEHIITSISDVDLLYHEATFKEDMVERAKETHHSTAAQAAQIASKAKVKRLLLGHFSARYKELDSLLDEAKEVFENVQLVEEGRTYSV